jgi:hypothetical protein
VTGGLIQRPNASRDMRNVGLVCVPIVADDAGGVAGMDLTVRFDSTAIAAQSASEGVLTSDFCFKPSRLAGGPPWEPVRRRLVRHVEGERAASRHATSGMDSARGL